MSEKYFLAIDQSTQGTKAILVDHNDKIFWKTSLPHHQIINDQGWVSHDLNEIEANLKELFKKVLSTISENQLLGLVITNQRESAAAWSRKTGKPLCLTNVWQDNRSDELIRRISIPEIKATVKNKTGLELSPYFTAAKWGWMLINEPRVKQAYVNNDLCLGTMDSWLVYKLTNGRDFKTEPSNACRTQMMDIRKKRWDSKLGTIFGIDIKCLPQIVDSNDHFGDTDLFGLLNHKIPILSVLGDSQAALFAHGCFKAGDFKVTFGTGSSVMLNIGTTLPPNLNNRLNTSIAWSLNGEISYVLEGNINYAGACVTWLKDSINLINSPAETGQLALTANPHDHTYLIPAFAGLGAPYWKPEMKAAFVGMSTSTTKKELVRATLNSLVYQINDILKEFHSLFPQLNSVIHTDGGMIHNSYLMQYLANITQKEVKISDIAELSALGAAMNAKNHRNGCLSSKSYLPMMEKAEVEKHTKGWTEWIEKLS